MGYPLVSVVIPVLNEAADIAGCIDAFGRAGLPTVGARGDRRRRTERRLDPRAAASAAVDVGFGSFRVLENPERGRSAGLNVGLRAATGAYFVRVDARSRVEPHYVRTCVERAPRASRSRRSRWGPDRPSSFAATSGGRPGTGTAQPVDLGFQPVSPIHGLGAGAEHVWMGAFRTDELRAIGGWDHGVSASEDFELSQRYVAAGQVVWFDARLQSGYLARPTLACLARQHYSFGRAKGTWWARGGRPLPRQLVILALPPVALGGVSIFARRFGLVPAVVAAGATALAVEGLGCPGPEGGVRERARSRCWGSRPTARAGGRAPWLASRPRGRACAPSAERRSRTGSPRAPSARWQWPTAGPRRRSPPRARVTGRG